MHFFNGLLDSPLYRHLASTVALIFLAGVVANVADAQHPTEVTSIVNSNADTTLEVNYDGGLLAPGKFAEPTNYSAPNDSIPAEGVGTRMMWYPAKAALRAGQIDIIDAAWNAENTGFSSVAFGRDTEASGFGSMAIGSRTTASGVQATAMGDNTIAASQNSLAIGKLNSANSSNDNTAFVVGNGSAGSRSDALVLKKDGDFGLSTSSPEAHLHVQESVHETGATNLSRHAAVVENTSTETGADVLGLKTSLNDPDSFTNFISFLDADEQVGTIHGDGSGGIGITGTSADYAEELPVTEGATAPEATDLVGVRGGTVSLETDGADRVMIASESPLMTGNATPATRADDDRRVEIAFIGQVPVRVRGSAEVGDLIVPSGEEDGTARAVAPSEYRRSAHGPIAGQAWSAKSNKAIGEVTVAVGLGSSSALAKQLDDERERNDRQENRIARLEERLTALEKSRSVLAGLPGSWLLGGGLFFFLLGGSVAILGQRRR